MTSDLDEFGRAVQLEAMRLRRPWGSGKVRERSAAEWSMAIVAEMARLCAELRAGRVGVAKACLVAAAALCANWHARLDAGRGQ